MKTTAAVLVQAGQIELAELDIPALRPGQVLIEVGFSGVCRSQILEWRGHRGPDPYLPHCLGHEGSGTVLEVGSEVRKVRAGDRVILSWMKGTGAEVPGTVYRWGERAVNAGGITTFSRHTVVSENRVTPLAAGVGLREAALVGCAIATGAGAVWNTAGATAGRSLAVFGVGGIGLCSVAGAAIAGCTPLIAVDVRPDALERARRLGATVSILAGTTDPVAEIRRLCPGGADFAIEATGRPEAMTQALACVRPRGGAAVVVGNARHGERVPLDPYELNQGKRLLGSWGGDNEPDRDFPRYLEWLRTGKLDAACLLLPPYPLERVTAALEDLEAGRAARPLIEMFPGRPAHS